jgi:hypothetical protein
LSLVKLAEKMVEKGQKEKGELYRGGISPAMIDATLREGSYLVPATGISVSAKGIASAVYCGGKHSGFCRTEDKEVTLEQKLIMKKLTTVPLSTLLRVRITPRPSPLQDSGNVGPEPSSAGASSSSSSRSSSSSSGDVATAAHPVIPPRAVFCPSCRMRLPGGITVQQHWSDFHFGPLPEKFAGASSSSSSTSDREAAAAETAAPAPEGPAARRLRPLWIQEVNRKEYGQDDEEVGHDLDLPEHEFVAHLFQAFELGGDHVWVACAAQTGSSSGVDGLPLFLEFEIFQRQHFPGHAMREPCCLLITGNRLATELAWTVKSNADGVGPQAKVRLEMLLHTVCRRFGVEVHTDERTGLERENGLVPLSKMRVDAAEVLSADVFAEAIREAAAQKESTALKRKEKQAKKKETSEKDKPKQNERKGEKQGEEEKKDESEGGEEDDSDDVFAAHHKPAVVKASAKPRLRRAQERSSEGEDSDQVFGAARRPTPKEKQQQPKEKLPAPRIRRVRTRRGRVFHGRPRDEEEVLVDSDGGRDSGEDSDGSVGSEGSLRELERHWGRIDLLEENLSEDEDGKKNKRRKTKPPVEIDLVKRAPSSAQQAFFLRTGMVPKTSPALHHPGCLLIRNLGRDALTTVTVKTAGIDWGKMCPACTVTVKALAAGDHNFRGRPSSSTATSSSSSASAAASSSSSSGSSCSPSGAVASASSASVARGTAPASASLSFPSPAQAFRGPQPGSAAFRRAARLRPVEEVRTRSLGGEEGSGPEHSRKRKTGPSG